MRKTSATCRALGALLSLVLTYETMAPAGVAYAVGSLRDEAATEATEATEEAVGNGQQDVLLSDADDVNNTDSIDATDVDDASDTSNTSVVSDASSDVDDADTTATGEAESADDVEPDPAEEARNVARLPSVAPAKVMAAPAAATSVTVVVHGRFLDKSGEWIESTYERTIAANGTWSVTEATFNSTVAKVVKSINASGTKYTYTGWSEDGDAVAFPRRFTNAEAADLAASSDDGKAHYHLTATYDVAEPVSVVVIFQGIRKANGTVTSSTQTQLLSSGTSWSWTSKKLDNLVPSKQFDYLGVRNTYAGQWADEDGNPVSSFSISYADALAMAQSSSDGTATFVYHPVYEEDVIAGLDYRYVDNISTGSGSWSNRSPEDYRSSFETMTHTFSNPEDSSPTLTPHYRFLHWQDIEHGKTYQAGESVTYRFVSNAGDQEYDIYAIWQPSVTLVYHDETGSVIGSSESFDEGVDVYGKVAPDADGNAFEGWYSQDGTRIPEGTTYAPPAATHEADTATELHVFARHYPAVRVSTQGGTYVYDGREHFATVSAEVVATEEDAYGDYEVIATTDASARHVTGPDGTIAGADTVSLTVLRDGEDVTDKVRIDWSGCVGTVVITPSPLLVTTDGASKEYDGTAITAGGNVHGFVDGEEVPWRVTGSQLDVGTSTNSYSIDWDDAAGSARRGDYELREALGLLSVTPRLVVVRAEDVIKTEGDPDPSVSVSVTGLVGSDAVSYDITREPGEDVGTYSINISGDERQGNYTVVFVGATMTITEPALAHADEPTDEPEPEVVPEGKMDVPGDGDGQDTPIDTPEDGLSSEVAPTPADGGGTAANAAPAAAVPQPPVAPVTASAPDAVTPPDADATRTSATSTPTRDAAVSPVSIDEEDVPLAAGIGGDVTALATVGSWALANLVSMLLTVGVALGMLVLFLRREDKDKDEEDEEDVAPDVKDENDDEENGKRRRKSKLLGTVPAVVSIVAFVLTEDMTLPMALFDRWTLLMVVFLLANVLLAVATRNRKRDDDEDEENRQDVSDSRRPVSSRATGRAA